MSMPSSLPAYIAGNKFGLGLRPGELNKVQADPRAWLQQQLQSITHVPASMSNMESSGPLLVSAVERLRSTRKAVESAKDTQGDAQQVGQKGKKKAKQITSEQMDAAQPEMATENAAQFPKQVISNERETRLEQRERLAARLKAAITTDSPFAERLVRFWSNHFTVAEGGGVKKSLREIAVPFENEAIRQNLNGNFASLLQAVEQHPAMLIYLDNIQSIGPSTRIAQRGKRGLNENLAREIMELHTLGVDGGYTQQDVTTLAKIITGWTVGGLSENKLLRALIGKPGEFLYADLMHESGSQLLLGKRYSQDGVAQGEAALKDLASHPATAHHIAFKLARHFIADQPPPEAVASLEKVFLETNGDLPSLHKAVITLDAAWDIEHKKLKTPEEFVISLGRGLDIAELNNRKGKNNFLLQALQTFNQVPFTAPSPAGWPDVADVWGSADALLKRIEWATAMAARMPAGTDALTLYADLLPEQAMLKQELSRAASSNQALALLVASPQFQWR